MGAAWAREEGATIVRGVLSVPLPLFDRNRTARAERSARAVAADAAVRALEGDVAREAIVARAEVEAALAALDAASGPALAAAEENLALAGEGHRAGRVGYVELLAVRRDALEARRARLDALEALHAARLELARATGDDAR